MIVIVTGSSGFVASELVPALKKTNLHVIGVDIIDSIHTDEVCNIADYDFPKCSDFIIINLAAIRQDFDFRPSDYYHRNVSEHEYFLNRIPYANCRGFFHVGSVASFDGANIPFTDTLSSDDAYRSTKSIQGKKIEDWCHKLNVHFVQLMPSAIYSKSSRSDTNIGKLQHLSRFLPVIPKISVNKSITYLPKFVSFLIHAINDDDVSGTYVTIERPVVNVTQIIQGQLPTPKPVVNIPFLRQMLTIISYIMLLLNRVTGFDFKLYPNRVKKLYSDTAYEWVDNVDQVLYNLYDEVSK